ncbi:MAG: ABC transporter ATP-binding protein [Bryobacteraceae bacterium]|nr:ABC transporter ATP-binding protein [Bryobacteraceae bacterium]
MRHVLRILGPYIRRYRKHVAMGVAALLLRNVAASAVPLMIKEAVDSLSHGFSAMAALGFAGALIGLTALKGAFQFAMRVILVGFSRDVEFDYRNDIFAHLVRMSSDFYARYRTGDIMARVTNDLNSVRGMLGPGIMYTTDTIATTVLGLGIMLWVDWRLTLMTLAPAPVIIVIVMVFGRWIHRRFRQIQALFSDVSSRVQENVTGVRVIRAYVQEESEQRTFEELNRDYIDQNLKLARLSGAFGPLLHALTSVSFLTVLWYGGYRLLNGDLTLGAFLMFNVYLGMLLFPMMAVGWISNMMQRGSASLLRINELMEYQPTVADPPQAVVLKEPIRGEIEFRDVRVRVTSAEPLKGVSLRIPAGGTVAFVGHTGSGKSTLVHLIPRLLDPTSGAVYLDGVDLRRLSLPQLRRQIGFVPQETFLFSATLAENIAFGVKEASEEEIRRAADLAGLTDDIADFPDGLQTVVGEKGITLSGGQKQRTAIARAVLRDPRILVLDDALSSVDTITEERILRGLSGIMRDRTTILISHRISTIRKADRIFVIEVGRVVEEGTHAELLASGGYYAELHQKQEIEEELQAI